MFPFYNTRTPQKRKLVTFRKVDSVATHKYLYQMLPLNNIPLGDCSQEILDCIYDGDIYQFHAQFQKTHYRTGVNYTNRMLNIDFNINILQ